MPTYQFNPHCHVKIWLSKNPASFLNIENQLRLIKMRCTNPSDTIHFVYDSRLLDLNAIRELNLFCDRHAFIAIDVQTILIHCRTRSESILVAMYQDEIENLGTKGGNPAVLSDILRLLSPIYSLGNYSDFDVVVNTQALPQFIEVKAPLLIRIGSFILNDNPSKLNITVNNDTWCVIDPREALPYIERIQTIAIQLAGIQSTSIPAMQNPYQNVPEFKEALLHRLSKHQTARQIRASINRLCATNQTFYRLILDLNNFSVEGEHRLFFKGKAVTMNEELLKQIAQNLRTKIASDAPSWSTQKKLERRSYLDKSDQFILDINRKEIQDELLEYTVVGTTGPDAYMLGLFGTNQFESTQIHQQVYPFALDFYNLEQVFRSTNTYPLGSTNTERERYRDQARNDISWKELGAQAQKTREDRMQNVACTIQRFFRKNHDKADLNVDGAIIKKTLL